MKRNIFIIIIIFVLAGIALYTNVIDKSSTNVTRPEVGFKAPEIELTSLDNQKYKISKINKPIVLNFWASWCGPCKIEAPSLVKMHQKYKDRVEFLAVNLTANDQLDNVKGFVEQYQFSLPVLLDQDGKVADQYQVRAIPTTFLIDKDKHIVKVVKGLHKEEDFEQMIQELLSGK
ncbi:MAG TPA: TlpA disulfide reductase family protein [Bacillota bacterium]|nr:TlpA disulfide reductase family protein [Bacillota bacterium]